MEARAAALLATMRDLSGIDPTEATRRRPVFTARMVVAARLLLEGWTEEQVALILGVTRTTVNYYRYKMADINARRLPGFETERELWTRFNETI